MAPPIFNPQRAQFKQTIHYFMLYFFKLKDGVYDPSPILVVLPTFAPLHGQCKCNLHLQMLIFHYYFRFITCSFTMKIMDYLKFIRCSFTEIINQQPLIVNAVGDLEFKIVTNFKDVGVVATQPVVYLTKLRHSLAQFFGQVLINLRAIALEDQFDLNLVKQISVEVIVRIYLSIFAHTISCV